MADTEPSLRITLKDVYTQVQEMKSLIERLAENLPTTAQKLDEHEKETKAIFQDHETRLRRVEMRVWQMMAIAGFLAAGMPIAINLLS
jgi:amino acid permease